MERQDLRARRRWVHRCIGCSVSVVAPGARFSSQLWMRTRTLTARKWIRRCRSASLVTGDAETLTLSETGVLRKSSATRPAADCNRSREPGDGVLQCSEAENLEACTLTHRIQKTRCPADLCAFRSPDGGGADNNWETAANWSGDALPTLYDTCVFDGTSSRTVIF